MKGMWRETTGTSPSPVHRSALSYATRATSLRLRFTQPATRCTEDNEDRRDEVTTEDA